MAGIAALAYGVGLVLAALLGGGGADAQGVRAVVRATWPSTPLLLEARYERGSA